jgi:hypothetical protein
LNQTETTTERRCVCGGEIAVDAHKAVKFCEPCRTPAARKARSRDTVRPTLALITVDPEGPLPGDDEWCQAHGFTSDDLKCHGVYRYDSTDARAVKGDFRGIVPDVDLVQVSKAVNQSPGLVMPKFAMPGSPPIPPQLRPDTEVLMDSRWTFHYHGRPRTKEDWPVYPANAGKLAGLKLIPVDKVNEFKKRLGDKTRKVGYVISAERAEPHINRAKSEKLYDSVTGEGDHQGFNLDYAHGHAPTKAKYVLIGDSKGMDVGPDGLESLLIADYVFHVLEGKLKHMAVESAGIAVVSNASVTLWNPREVRRYATWMRENLPGVPVFISPDADWMDFDLNRGAVFRQAMYLRTVYREVGVDAHVVAPRVSPGQIQCKCKPVGLIAVPAEGVEDGTTCYDCGGYLKGDDDYFGAGGKVENMSVLDREEPLDHIYAFVDGLPIPRQRKPRTRRVLCGLSLHDRDDYNLLNAPLKTFQKMTGARRPEDVCDILEDLRDALNVEGSLEIAKQEYVRDDATIAIAWDWIERPRIRVRDEFRATEQQPRFEDFWAQRSNMTLKQLEARVSRLESSNAQLESGVSQLREQVEYIEGNSIVSGFENLLESEDAESRWQQ